MEVMDYREFDRKIWEKELENFVPNLIYDMHTHIWSEMHRGQLSGPPTGLRQNCNYHDQLVWASKLFPGRKMHYLVLGTPIPGMDVEGHNDWMAKQMAVDPKSEVNMLISPEMTPDYVARQIKKHDFFGLKPYRTFGPKPDNGRIKDFLPEALIEVAHDLGLAITLHLSKKSGPADPENIKDLKVYTQKYHKAQWILAHCARSFNSFMLEESIHRLKDIPNIWYDTSAINDLYTHYLLIKHEDRERVMFGSDNIAAGCLRGKYITYGKAWMICEGNLNLSHCDPTPTFVIYEQLRQERQIADMLGLTQKEIENHFSGNAIRFIQTVRSKRTTA